MKKMPLCFRTQGEMYTITQTVSLWGKKFATHDGRTPPIYVYGFITMCMDPTIQPSQDKEYQDNFISRICIMGINAVFNH